MLLRDLTRVLVPLHCAGCGRGDVVLCGPCRRDLAGPPRPVDVLAVGPVGTRGVGDGTTAPVFSLAPYEGRARRTVLAWKGGSRRDLEPVLGALGRRAGRELAARPPVVGVCPGAGRVLAVVPAPSGFLRRVRGTLVVASWARSVARGVAEGLGAAPAGASLETGAVAEVVVVDLLVRRGGSQRGRDRRGRARREVDARAELPPGTPVLLVDDVLTTGATLGACARAVERAGGVVVAAVTLADAGRPRASEAGGTAVPGS